MAHDLLFLFAADSGKWTQKTNFYNEKMPLNTILWISLTHLSPSSSCYMPVFCWGKRRAAPRGCLAYNTSQFHYLHGEICYRKVWWWQQKCRTPWPSSIKAVPLGNWKLIRFSLLWSSLFYVHNCCIILWLDHGIIVMCPIIKWYIMCWCWESLFPT